MCRCCSAPASSLLAGALLILLLLSHTPSCSCSTRRRSRRPVNTGVPALHAIAFSPPPADGLGLMEFYWWALAGVASVRVRPALHHPNEGGRPKDGALWVVSGVFSASLLSGSGGETASVYLEANRRFSLRFCRFLQHLQPASTGPPQLVHHHWTPPLQPSCCSSSPHVPVRLDGGSRLSLVLDSWRMERGWRADLLLGCFQLRRLPLCG